MIRILQVLGGLSRGGAETMVMNLYRAIDRTKIQFDFIIHTSEHQDFTDEVLSLGGRIYSFPKFRVYNYFSMMRIWDNFFKEHPEYRILHSHVRSYASLYLPIAKKHGLTTIVHSHSTSEGKGIISFIKRLMQSPLKRQADYLFSCSLEAGKWLFGEDAILRDNYRMIPNAVDTSKFAFNEDVRKKMRLALEIDEAAVVFGHVGRFHPAKNHLFMLDIFKGVVDKNPDALLLLVGDGELREKIENRIAELGIEKSVKLLGSRSDVADLLQAMDIFVFPSSWEGLPVTVVEAQAAGLPCFVSDTVTKDVNVSELVKNLPISCGVTSWVDILSSVKPYRLDVIDAIKRAGFDIKSAAEQLALFYEDNQ